MNAEGWVVPKDGAFSFGVVEVGGLIEDFGALGEDEESVGETFWNPKELEFVGGGLGFEVKTGPFAEVGRVSAQIDGDVPDMAGEGSDELSLRFAELVVQASEDTFDGERLVILNELGGQTGVGKR